MLADSSTKQYMVACSSLGLFMIVEIIPIFFVVDKSFIDLFVRRKREKDLKESLLSFEAASVTGQSENQSHSLLSNDRYYLPNANIIRFQQDTSNSMKSDLTSSKTLVIQYPTHTS
jgi:hypothetical protein